MKTKKVGVGYFIQYSSELGDTPPRVGGFVFDSTQHQLCTTPPIPGNHRQTVCVGIPIVDGEGGVLPASGNECEKCGQLPIAPDTKAVRRRYCAVVL